MSNSPKSIPLSRKLITTIVKKGTEFTEAISQVVKEKDLTVQQFNVLRILRGRHGKPASLQDVSKDMLHANSNTTRVIDKLVTKDLAKRVQSPKDRRQIELTITDAGLDLLKTLDGKVDQRENELVMNLTGKDMNALIESLKGLE